MFPQICKANFRIWRSSRLYSIRWTTSKPNHYFLFDLLAVIKDFGFCASRRHFCGTGEAVNLLLSTLNNSWDSINVDCVIPRYEYLARDYQWANEWIFQSYNVLDISDTGYFRQFIELVRLQETVLKYISISSYRSVPFILDAAL